MEGIKITEWPSWKTPKVVYKGGVEWKVSLTIHKLLDEMGALVGNM